jgi:hypothetical protein
MINEELKSPGFMPARVIRMRLKSDYNGVAYCANDSITGSVKYFKAHPNDVGAMVHETAHVVQHYRSARNPSWLVEGVADYVRWFKWETRKPRRPDSGRAHYNDSYQTSAAFLVFLTDKYDKSIVNKLNGLMREGKYKADAFSTITGKSLEQLDVEWRESLRR